MEVEGKKEKEKHTHILLKFDTLLNLAPPAAVSSNNNNNNNNNKGNKTSDDWQQVGK